MEKLHVSSRLRTIWDGIRTSLWFVPSIMMVAAGVLATVGIWLDLNVFGADNQNLPWWIYVSEPSDARNVVSTLLSSMITMASLVFSITMVVLSLAASQFGPRLIRNFMANPRTQIVLGTFVMVILYCLIVLSAVGWRGSEGEFPFSTVTIAIVLVGVSVGLLILFIHTLARSIVSETVIERVGCELDDLLKKLEPLGPDVRKDNPEEALPDDFERKAVRFGPGIAGYIQAIEFDMLIKLGYRFGVVIGLYFQPGDFVAQNGRGIAIYPREKDAAELRTKILTAIAVGVHRTPVQDIAYPVRHLVEVAVRALSPGINDPYTAVSVVHRLSASLSQLMERTLPPAVLRDDSGVVRVICPRQRYETLIGAAFDQIRQYSADKPLVVIHQIEALSRIAEHATLPCQLAALRKQMSMLAEDADRNISNASDRAAVKTAKRLHSLET
jgi:uncharacterized membrane protein